MKKLLIFIFLLIFCNTAYADNNHFAWGLSEEEGIKLLTGEKSIPLLTLIHHSIKDELRADVVSDIDLKCLSIGMETSDYKWETPFLAIEFALLPVPGDLYSGTVGLSFFTTAESQKGGVPLYATVWEYTVMTVNTNEQQIRNLFKNIMDKFLIVYLKANPRKFIDDMPDKKNQ